MDKNCDNCKHCCSVPYTDCAPGFECDILICEKKRADFHAGGGNPGTCDLWAEKHPKGIPFYLQPGWKPRH